MIKIENLSKYFRTEEVETIALNNVSLEVKDSEFVAIMCQIFGRTNSFNVFIGRLF